MSSLFKKPKVKRDLAAEAANRNAREQAYRDQQEAAEKSRKKQAATGYRSLLGGDRTQSAGTSLSGGKSMLGSSPRKRV